MVLSIGNRIGDGSFADVFVTANPQVVCKLYRAVGSEKWRKWAPRVHESEADAYEIAHNDALLRKHVPRYDGVAKVTAVIDGEVDFSNDYLLETGLLLEKLAGEEEKATQLSPQRYPHIYSLAHSFEEAGIDVGDSSAFNYSDPRAVKFIDIHTFFGTRIISEVAW